MTRRPPARVERAVAAGFVPGLLAAFAGADDRFTVDVDGEAVAFTHLDRIYWPADPDLSQPATTKRDYLRYLVEVAPVLLPHVRDRPLTLFRWPEGLAHRRVLEKHWEIALPPFVERVRVYSDSKRHADQYILCNNLPTLLWLAHMGTLEFHMWHSRVREGDDAPDAAGDFADSLAALQASILERPDYVLFDLDPFIGRVAAGKREPAFDPAAFAKVKAIASSLHALLAGIGLASLVKTSGKTGLHVIVPYSPRGLPGAPVSMPLAWEALDGASSTDFRLATVPAYVRAHGDAWAGWLARKQDVMHRLAASAA